MKNLNTLFSPKSIAIVGASPKKGKLGNVLVENIKKGGWKGKLYLVNPKYTPKNRSYFSSLSEIKKPVDLVLIAIPAKFVNRIIEEGAKSRPAIKNFTIISSGFKETGKDGKILEENLEKIAKKYKLNLLGPNCLGFINPYTNLNATFTDVMPRKGNVAIVSQSGALAVAFLDWAAGKNIGFSKIVSIGNKTILDESKIIEYLARDKKTKAIALYLEDIKNGPDFIQALLKTTSRKPIIILKTGKTSAGQKAISSHTGSLAQDEEIIEAVFEKFNVIPADNIEEFQDFIYYLDSDSIPQKNEVIILTNAGGPGVMASDFIGKSKKIKLLKLTDKAQEELKENLPASASVENPIDVIGDAPPERYGKSLKLIVKYFPQNPVLAILTPQNQTDPEKVAHILAKYKTKISNLSACFMGGEKIEKAKAVLENNKIPNFENPERALAVMEKLMKYTQKLNSWKIPRVELLENSEVGAIIQTALAEKRPMLFWKEAENLFDRYKIKLARSISFENYGELKNKKIPYPCVLKTDDPSIYHRLEKKAVILEIQNEKELLGAYNKIKKDTGATHFLLQPMAKPGLELIIGMKRDPVFGTVVIGGWGGSFTEIFRDKVILLPPLNLNEIKNKLSQLTIFPILKGFRGEKGYNLNEISATIAAVSQIALENREIKEIDINPLVVYNDGKSGLILDAKIFLS